MFLLVPAYPGCPGSKAVKRSLLLLLLSVWEYYLSGCVCYGSTSITVEQFCDDVLVLTEVVLYYFYIFLRKGHNQRASPEFLKI